MLIQGRTYRFAAWPDDGETFRVEGRRLVNLTTPGGDLLLDEDGEVRCLDGRRHEPSANALVPWAQA